MCFPQGFGLEILKLLLFILGLRKSVNIFTYIIDNESQVSHHQRKKARMNHGLESEVWVWAHDLIIDRERERTDRQKNERRQTQTHVFAWLVYLHICPNPWQGLEAITFQYHRSTPRTQALTSKYHSAIKGNKKGWGQKKDLQKYWPELSKCCANNMPAYSRRSTNPKQNMKKSTPNQIAQNNKEKNLKNCQRKQKYYI